MGYIKLILGCMFSGKTSELITEYYRWINIKKVLVINYLKDDRYGNDDFLYSHNSIKIPCMRVMNLKDIPKEHVINHDIILINEGQFFSDLTPFVLEWGEKYDKTIFIAALDGDYLRNPFQSIVEIFPKVNEIVKLTAVCYACKKKEAIFTHRLTTETEIEVIGTNNYVPLCREHYLKNYLKN